MAPAIRVEGLWKEYVLGQSQRTHGTFYELLASKLRLPNAERRAAEQADQHFWALRDVSFAVQPGEVVGIIGRNGAGKSTLLKILSRIAAPTRGHIEARGRLASLLEVGTGFHPELSGRENIFLNGAILGMKRAEIARKFDDIVAFAEVEKFIDTPVKRYSSGMYVRLAFSVAASLDVDVLIVDEVLAVGDSAFQEKCLAKMGGLSSGGKTVLFVSHDHSAVSRLCSRAILLSEGGVMFDGRSNDALATYASMSQGVGTASSLHATGPLSQSLSFESFTVNDSASVLGNVCRPSEELVFCVSARAHIAIAKLRVTVLIYKQGQLVVGLHDVEVPENTEAGKFESQVRLSAFFLSPGDYSIDISAATERGEWMLAKQIAMFSLSTEHHAEYEPSHIMGFVNVRNAGARRWISSAERQ